jgi:hypothetical protein
LVRDNAPTLPVILKYIQDDDGWKVKNNPLRSAL